MRTSVLLISNPILCSHTKAMIVLVKRRKDTHFFNILNWAWPVRCVKYARMDIPIMSHICGLFFNYCFTFATGGFTVCKIAASTFMSIVSPHKQTKLIWSNPLLKPSSWYHSICEWRWLYKRSKPKIFSNGWQWVSFLHGSYLVLEEVLICRAVWEGCPILLSSAVMGM